MLTSVYHTASMSIYEIKDNDTPYPLINRYIVSTAETREICNDPQICGVEYTRKLQTVCTELLKAIPSISPIKLQEDRVVVVNRLNEGINFGLREALSDAYGWNIHSTIYISNTNDISEDTFDQKEYSLPKLTQVILGDVISDTNQLKSQLTRLIKAAEKESDQIENILIFTIGGNLTEEALLEIANVCSKQFSSFTGIELFYLEGRFIVPDKNTELSIKKEGRDLAKKNALMSPEYILSQYELPFYALERCVNYNGELRANNIPQFIDEVIEYWEAIKKEAMEGLSFEELLKERFPEIEASKFGKQNLMSLAEQHITKLKRIPLPKQFE